MKSEKFKIMHLGDQELQHVQYRAPSQGIFYIYSGRHDGDLDEVHNSVPSDNLILT